MSKLVLVASGARWGSTAGGQRYQQLVLHLQPYLESIGCRVAFYPSDMTVPPSLYWDGSPPSCIVIGYPPYYREDFKKTLLSHRSVPVIYDVCDYWKGGELGGDVGLLSASDEELVDEAVLLVFVSVQLAAAYFSTAKPFLVIPNGLRWEFLQESFDFPVDDVVHCYWWGSHYLGQTWVNVEVLQALPQLFPKVHFHYFFASDHLQPEMFSSPYGNIHVEISAGGVPLEHIWQFIKYPAVGLVPFNHNNSAAFYADPIKVYEYWALGFTVICSNVFSGLGFHPSIHYGWGDPKEVIPYLLHEVLEKGALSSHPPSLKDRLAHSWDARAQMYFRILQPILT